MREIKFRAKEIGSKGKWRVGDLHIIATKPHIHSLSNKYLIKIETIGQFTGLHDWCGNEIYEGDILESLDWDKETKFVVEWNQVLAQFQGRWLHQPAIACDIYSICHSSNYGVCGNIHDNPELLKTTVI